MSAPNNPHGPHGNWQPQIIQSAPGRRVEQWTEYNYAERVVIEADGRMAMQFGASWRWFTTSAHHLPPAARAPLIAPVSLYRPTILTRAAWDGHQLPWAAGSPVPRQLALPAPGGWWQRLLGGSTR